MIHIIGNHVYQEGSDPLNAKRKNSGFETRMSTLWSRAIRKRDPFCKICGRPSEDAHHILKKSQAKGLKFDLRNGMGVCRRCHSEVIHANYKSWLRVFFADNPELAEYLTALKKKVIYSTDLEAIEKTLKESG